MVRQSSISHPKAKVIRGKMKLCSKCGLLKPLIDFHKHSVMKDGLRSKCKQCRKEESLLYYKDNKKQYKFHATKNPDRTQATRTISAHKQRGFDVKISIDELEQMFHNSLICPICGKDYKRNDNNIYTSKSFDRIDDSIILTKDNTWIICFQCNSAKGKLSMKEFIRYCKSVITNYGDN